ncbi:MAG: hypothetical protein QXX24_02820, partial [Candidatus Bathyarchaeia archaeon]
NWKLAAIILIVLNCLWYLSPPGLLVPYYPILHLIALALIFIFRGKILDLINREDKRGVMIGATIVSFSGMMANHMMGNLIFIGSVNWFIQLKGVKDALVNLGFYWLKSGLPKIDPTGLGTIFTLTFPVYIVERLIFTAVASLICSSIIYALRKSSIIEI